MQRFKGRAWTQEQTDLALKLYADGMSMSDIGLQVGKTRSAVGGRLRRVGTGALKRAPVAPKTQKAEKPAPRPKLIRVAPRPVVPEMPRLSPPDLPTGAVELMQLRDHHCRFPLWSLPNETKFFCGEDNGGRTYCPVHFKLCGSVIPARGVHRITSP